MLYIKVVEKIKTRILCSIAFFPENRAVYEINVEKCGGAVEATDDNMAHACCVLSNARLAHAATRKHRRARIHTQKYVILIAFPLQQCLLERPSLLCYTYIACLVGNVRSWEKKFCDVTPTPTHTRRQIPGYSNVHLSALRTKGHMEGNV